MGFPRIFSVLLCAALAPVAAYGHDVPPSRDAAIMTMSAYAKGLRGFVGGWGTGKALNKTSNEAFGHKIQSAMEAAGRYPYYDGGVGWPVLPGK